MPMENPCRAWRSCHAGRDLRGHGDLAKVKGQPGLPPFRYFDKGSLAVIGRWAAVANAFGVHLSGLVCPYGF